MQALRAVSWLSVLWLCAAHAAAQSHGVREHDGFFLRLSVGPAAGAGGYREPVDGAPVSVRSRGAGLDAELSVGGRARAGWLLHAGVSWSTLIRTARQPAAVRRASPHTTAQLLLLAPGVSHYWARSQLFLSLAAGMAFITELRAGAPVLESEPGVGLSACAGWQPWLGEAGQWGLGPAVRASYFDAPAQLARVDSRARFWLISLQLSAAWS